MKKRERYTPTEFIGLNEIEAIILKAFKWIFRVLPNPDVGIDAQIELVDDGYPNAKFIALQIKKGTSNFYLNAKKTKASYYASFEHYEYWTNSSIPVFVMGLLDDGEIYWQYASDKSLYQELSASFRLDIPLENKLTLNKKDKIEAICLAHLNQLNITEENEKFLNSIMEYNSEINYILRDFNETILNISNYIQHYTNRTNELGKLGNEALNLSYEEQLAIKKVLIGKYTLQINALSNRMKSETNMSKEYFKEIKDLMLRKRKIVERTIEDKILEYFLGNPYQEFFNKLEKAIYSTKTMNKSIQVHPSYDAKFRKAKRNSKANFSKLTNLLISVRDLIKEEITTFNKRKTIEPK